MSIPRFIEIMRKQGLHYIQSNFLLGEISSVNPIQVTTNNITLDSDQFKKVRNETFQIGDEVILLVTPNYYVILGGLEEVT